METIEEYNKVSLIKPGSLIRVKMLTLFAYFDVSCKTDMRLLKGDIGVFIKKDFVFYHEKQTWYVSALFKGAKTLFFYREETNENLVLNWFEVVE